MLVLTGREAHTLPAATVRRLMWRIDARNLWDPDLARALRSPIPDGATLSDKVARADARAALAGLEALVFPEGD